MINVYSLTRLFVNAQKVRIFDCSSDIEMIFEGYSDDIPEEIQDYIVSSVDNIPVRCDGYFGINIVGCY